MNKKTIYQYTVLFQYLLLLKHPIYVFLIQIFQKLAPKAWWGNYIQPVVKDDEKINFKYLDIADLLNIFKINWETIFRHLDKKYYKYKYDNEFKIVDKFHQIRNIVAHANENDMNMMVFVDYLSDILKFSDLINVDEEIKQKIEMDLKKHKSKLPSEIPVNNDRLLMEKIVRKIDDEVLLHAISCATLDPNIKISINRTTMRFHSMRTIEEIMGFFNGATERSEGGKKIKEELHKNGLRALEDIKAEINLMYEENILMTNGISHNDIRNTS
jgi:hypothetical protein